MPPLVSELIVAQPDNQIDAIPRAICGSFEHPALDGIISFHGFQAFRQLAGSFPGAAQIEEKQDDCSNEPAYRRQTQCPARCENPAEQGDHHRRPRCQSSSRA